MKKTGHIWIYLVRDGKFPGRDGTKIARDGPGQGTPGNPGNGKFQLDTTHNKIWKFAPFNSVTATATPTATTTDLKVKNPCRTKKLWGEELWVTKPWTAYAFYIVIITGKTRNKCQKGPKIFVPFPVPSRPGTSIFCPVSREIFFREIN